MTVEIETVSLTDVRPYHRNPRTHDPESVEHVQDSIQTFGFRVPIVLDSENTIVAGHGRFKAVQQLAGELDAYLDELTAEGRDSLVANLSVINSGQIFAIREDELSRHERSHLRISDNRISELRSWNTDLLVEELERIGVGPDTPIAGYTDEELDALLDVDFEIAEPEPERELGDTIGLVDEEQPAVELICPHCLEEFEMDVELAKYELELLD